MKVHCKYDAMVPISELKPHSKNRNLHPQDQIERLAQLLAYQGIRAPIVVSNLSGKIVKGHGTLEAIKLNEWTEAPVVYQDFESSDQEYAFVQSDNSIAEWATLDLKAINADLPELGPDLDLDMLGFKDFSIDPPRGDLIPGDVEFSKEIDDKNDYIVLLFDKKEDFKKACEKLSIKTVKQNLSTNQDNPNFLCSGIGRIVDGKTFVDRLG